MIIFSLWKFDQAVSLGKSDRKNAESNFQSSLKMLPYQTSLTLLLAFDLTQEAPSNLRGGNEVLFVCLQFWIGKKLLKDSMVSSAVRQQLFNLKCSAQIQTRNGIKKAFGGIQLIFTWHPSKKFAYLSVVCDMQQSKEKCWWVNNYFRS